MRLYVVLHVQTGGATLDYTVCVSFDTEVLHLPLCRCGELFDLRWRKSSGCKVQPTRLQLPPACAATPLLR